MGCGPSLCAYLLQVISVDDDVQATQLGQAELILIHTGVADLLPGAGAVGLAGSLHSGLELVQAHQAACQSPVVGDVGKQDTGCLIQALIEDPVTNTLQEGRNVSGMLGTWKSCYMLCWLRWWLYTSTLLMSACSAS